MKFSQLICWGESRLEPKFLKKSVRPILSYFWFHIFLVCEKYVFSVSARKFFLRAKVAPEDLF